MDGRLLRELAPSTSADTSGCRNEQVWFAYPSGLYAVGETARPIVYTRTTTVRPDRIREGSRGASKSQDGNLLRSAAKVTTDRL